MWSGVCVVIPPTPFYVVAATVSPCCSVPSVQQEVSLQIFPQWGNYTLQFKGPPRSKSKLRPESILLLLFWHVTQFLKYSFSLSSVCFGWRCWCSSVTSGVIYCVSDVHMDLCVDKAGLEPVLQFFMQKSLVPVIKFTKFAGFFKCMPLKIL